ncbi:Methyltransferase type 11 [Artemisia annua]|uniref:Methyltransferase type 11 n=1 Tax=Artemisia annua TaxID=35608 RepID=A0A2U1MQ38_ARTAN|nr:Methyltransferase type 11 [Artemisia annua]
MRHIASQHGAMILGTFSSGHGADLNENEAKKKTLACFICYDPLIWNGDLVFSVDSMPRSILKCGISDLNENEAKKKTLACFICYDPLIWNGDLVFSVDSMPRSILKCGICKKVYSGNENHLDLIVTSGSKKYGEYMPSEIFRLPLVSFLYERGWRQAFSIWGGFPGPEREFFVVCIDIEEGIAKQNAKAKGMGFSED